MKYFPSWPLVCLAALSAVLAGCAAEPADSTKAAESSASSCVGVAPTTGSMLRRKQDCDAEKMRAPMTEAEIQELRQRNGALAPRGGAGKAQ
jgi:curli biogenesis system outer membrane secretion channel CsgG